MSVADHRAAAVETAQPPKAARRCADEPLRCLQGGLIPSPAGVLALQRTAGNRATATALRREHVPRRMVQRLGYPLDKPLPNGAPKPTHGEKKGQRRYSVAQFESMWSAQFHAMTGDEGANVDRGCIGITVVNLGLGSDKNPPLGEVYGTLEQARKVAAARNEGLGPVDATSGVKVWVAFGMLFWSNRNAGANAEPDQRAFRPDPSTGRVDMSTIGSLRTSKPGAINFDFGFWDTMTGSFWHANHMDYGDPNQPEIIFQSTPGKFAHKTGTGRDERVTYDDFDRIVYGVAETMIFPEKLLLPTRDDHIAALKAAVNRGDWADAALRLNGFGADDIKAMGRTFTHAERTMIIGAAYGAMPGWSDRVVDGLTAVENEPPPRAVVLSALDASIAGRNWVDVALRLNGLGDADLKARARALTKGQRAAVAAAAPTAMPGFETRVTDALAEADKAATARKPAARR